MSKPTEPELPSFRLRLDRFEQYCAERVDGKTTAAKAKFIGVSRPQLSKVTRDVQPATPGQGFIAATLLAFRDETKTAGDVLDTLFEIVPVSEADEAAA